MLIAGGAELQLPISHDRAESWSSRFARRTNHLLLPCYHLGLGILSRDAQNKLSSDGEMIAAKD